MDVRQESFYSVLRQAISDITEHGFDQANRLAYWTDRLRSAAERSLMPMWKVEDRMRLALGTIYRRLVDRGEVARWHPGIAKYTLAQVSPKLRTELDRRIMASANLIKLNRDAAIQQTLQRFQGWATSIPVGGSDVVDRKSEADDLRKSLGSLPFRERRVIIDQGHKLSSSISQIVAEGGGAIAMIWRSNWRQANYDFREDHKDRDGKVYLVRGSWANEKGLVKPGSAGYSDEITQTGEEVFCRCYATYLYNLRDLPDDMLTENGRSELARAREAAR